MEQRQGAEYDFNGQLLADMLDSCAAQDPHAVVILAMMFISPGRHAGPGGDIETICRDAMQKNPVCGSVSRAWLASIRLLVDILEPAPASAALAGFSQPRLWRSGRMSLTATSTRFRQWWASTEYLRSGRRRDSSAQPGPGSGDLIAGDAAKIDLLVLHAVRLDVE